MPLQCISLVELQHNNELHSGRATIATHLGSARSPLVMVTFMKRVIVANFTKLADSRITYLSANSTSPPTGSCADIMHSAEPFKNGFQESVVAIILKYVVQGLQYLHSLGYVHRYRCTCKVIHIRNNKAEHDSYLQCIIANPVFRSCSVHIKVHFDSIVNTYALILLTVLNVQYTCIKYRSSET